MENLKDYLGTYCLDTIARNSYYWEQALDFFGGNVPQKYVDLYENKKLLSNEFILEYIPDTAKEVTDEIFNNHLYLYHFTDKDSANNILKNGLHCKREIPQELPKRIYMYASKNKIDLNNPEIKNFIDKVVNYNKVKRYGLAILRISNNREFILYKDTAMKNLCAVFAYENIPAEYIKEIKIK